MSRESILNLGAGEAKCRSCDGPGCKECLGYGKEAIRTAFMKARQQATEFIRAA